MKHGGDEKTTHSCLSAARDAALQLGLGPSYDLVNILRNSDYCLKG